MITYTALLELLDNVFEQPWEVPVTEKLTEPANVHNRGPRIFFGKSYHWLVDEKGRLTLRHFGRQL